MGSIMGTFVNRLLSKVGLRLDRAVERKAAAVASVPPARVPSKGKALGRPPKATFDNVALVLEQFTTARPGAVFVQVGANDGETSDSVNAFVKRGVLRSILVEPVHENFVKLERFYADVPNVRLVEAAMDHKSGKASIYMVKDAGRWAGSVWATQLASFDREHLIRSGIMAEEIEERSVECLDFPALMRRCDVDRIDVLQIDVEGFDAEVVRMALALPEPPLCICFEFVQFVKHMDQEAINGFYAELASKGYTWSHDRINTMAIHQRYVKSGLPEPRK